jgi:hypothetical protein
MSREHQTIHAMSSRTWPCIAALLSLVEGCDGSLSSQRMEPESQVIAGQSGRIHNTLEADGVVLSRVNASDAMSWVYVQLRSGQEVQPQDPQRSTDWDLALQRYHVKVNGGISGSAGAEVALISDAAFAAIGAAPAAGYVTDQADSADEDSDPDYAFAQRGTWYSYNVMTHVLTAKPQVYVLRAASGTYYKLQFTGYYDAAGSSGYPTLRWQAIQAP